MKAVRLFTLLFFTTSFTFAQSGIIGVTCFEKSIKEYQRFDVQIKVVAPFTNPYDQADIKLDMILTSPSGKALVLPCYFENGDSKLSVWRARFAPQETGEYQYYFLLKSKAGESKGEAAFFSSESNPKKKGFLHKNNLWTFKYDNGELFRGVGENIGWEARTFENDKWTYDYLLPKLSNNGANFFRTWMCYWNLPLQWKTVGSTKRYTNSDEYFNPGAIKRMDGLVRMTDSLNLKFMLTMDWHGHLMEGGWKNSNYNVANGGPAKTPTEFFTSQQARAMYKNKLRYIIARWGYSTSIAAFEFFNEIDNAAFNGADSVLIPHHIITEWHDEMSRYLKDIDPYGHLVTTSVSHRDITGMNSIAYIDFNQKHIYKNTGKIPAIYQDYINMFGKPYVVGEFGYRWEDADPQYANLADFDFKRGLWYGLFSPCPILPMSWWWEFFDDQNMEPYFKGVREISDEMLKAGNGSFEQFSVSSGVIESHCVKCGNKYFIYLLNNTLGTSPVPAKISIPVNGKNFTVQYFDPEGQKTIDVGKLTANGALLYLNSKLIPSQKKDRVIIIKAN